jgi:tetratricopeptide (TPR) repeat protein
LPDVLPAARPVVPPPPQSERDRKILLGLAARIDAGDSGAHNNLGVLYFNKGMLDEAVAQFQRALEIDPRMQVAQRNLEIAYFNTGYYHEVIRELSERLRSVPEDTAARRKLARAYLSTGDHAAAIRELSYILAETPNDLQTLLELGRVEKEAGRYDAALVWFQRAIELDPESGVLRFHMGELEYHRGMVAEARGHLERAIARLPDFADAHHLLAFVLGDLGEDRGAQEAAARARKLNPAFARAETNLSLDQYNPARYGELVGEREGRPDAVQNGYLAGYHLGIAYRQRGLYTEALRELDRALELGEDKGLVRQAIAEVRLVRGEVAEAAELYRELLRNAPRSPKLLNELGVAQHRAGETAAAERSYRRALEADPDYALAWNNLAAVRMHRGDAVAAGECLARAVELHPALVDGWSNLGLLAEQTGRLPEALRSYRAGIEADEKALAAWIGAGRVLSEMDRFEEARNALARAAEIDPESPAARYHLGFVLGRLGEFDAARRETERALALDPYYPAPRYRLAIDLQFEYTEVLAPELDAASRVAAGEAVPSFDFDAAQLADAFQALQAPQPKPAPPPDELDPFRLARDYLSKGLLARAAAEVRRLAVAGVEPVEAAVLAGEILMRQGYYGEALERFDAALTRLEGRGPDPRTGRIWLARADALLRLGRATEAHESARQAEANAAVGVEALRSHGKAFLLEGDAGAAVESFRRLSAARPDDPAPQRELGAALRLAGDLHGAEEALRRALSLDPDFVAARVDLADVLLESGREEEAAAACETALEFLPGYPDAVMLLAEARRRQRRFEEGVDLLVDLLSRDAFHVAALCALGRTLAEADRPDDARRALERALRLEPESAEARLELGRLARGAGRYREAAHHWIAAVEHGAEEAAAVAAREELGSLAPTGRA